MPIYIEYEGIKGNVTYTAGNGGVWKTTNFPRGETARSSGVFAYDSAFRGGVHVAVGGGLGKTGTGTLVFGGSNAIEVSRIIFANAPAGLNFIDSRDANAVSKARMIIGAQRSGRTIELVFNGAAHNFWKINKLKQIAASGRRIPLMKLVVVDSSNQTCVAVELENCLISSYSISGHGGST